MKDFLKICLVKDPYLRPGTEELMNHPFIQKENDPESIQDARAQFLKIITPFREEKAEKAAKEESTVLMAPGAVKGKDEN
jgi:serine/threonine protein kinase